MPELFKPPAALFPSEIKAIALYLLSLAQDTVSQTIEFPLDYWQQKARSPQMTISGNPENGKRLFFDLSGPAACVSCHKIDDSQSDERLGPNLSNIGKIRTPEHLYWKIVKPDSNIVSGYNLEMIKLKSGRILSGLVEEEGELLKLIGTNLRVTRVPQDQVERRVKQQISSMPGNYSDLLTQQQIFDLTVFMVGK